MNGTAVNQHEEKNRKTGAAFSFVVHIVLFALALLPFLTFPDPPPGQEGILVNLGIPDVGQGEENAPIASSEPEESEPETQPTPLLKRNSLNLNQLKKSHNLSRNQK